MVFSFPPTPENYLYCMIIIFFLVPFLFMMMAMPYIIPKLRIKGHYVRDFFHIANTDVLIIGLLLLLGALLIRTLYERSSSWIRWYMPDMIYEKFLE